MIMDRKQLAGMIDHTMLKPDARRLDIERLCREAMEYGFAAVCVNGAWVAYCRERLEGSGVKVAAVCGFPLGAMDAGAKAFEAARAAEQGAMEIDMVLQVGLLLDGRYREVEDDIRGVVEAVRDQAIVKVILETGFLDEGKIRDACRLAEQAGAHFVKTSTGFGPGGATVEHVRLMRSSVSPSMGVKASGGIRSLEAAQRMIEAGANRIGTSSGVSIMQGLEAGTGGSQPDSGSGY